MTDSNDTDRLALLEAQIANLNFAVAALATPKPLAAVPPITVGELTDVPAPGSPIASAWAQEVSNRVVQRFATKAALDGWAAAEGSIAYVSGTRRLFSRMAGVWRIVGGRMPGCMLYMSTTQLIPDTTRTPVLWDGEYWDDDNLHIAGSPSRITIPVGMGGLWTFGYSIAWQFAGVSPLFCRSFIRRTVSGGGTDEWAGAGHNTNVTWCAASTSDIQVSETDYLEVVVEQGLNPTNPRTLNPTGVGSVTRFYGVYRGPT